MESIAPADPECLRLPEVEMLFSRRAERFRQLAPIHPSVAGYLQLMADLARTQHELAEAPRDWRRLLRDLVRRMATLRGNLLGPLQTLENAADEDLETWADRLWSGDVASLDPGFAPFLAAALQVARTLQAAGVDPVVVGGSHAPFRCPVCGALPVASLLQTGGTVHGIRYLYCSFCSTQWRRVRLHCIHCESSRGVAYFGIQGAGELVKAEACSDCKSYLKIIDRDRAPTVDPFADDIATLGLDLLMAEQGYARLGFNPLLILGV